MKTKFVVHVDEQTGDRYYYAENRAHAGNPHDAVQFEYYESAQSFIFTTLSVWEPKAIFRIDKIFVP
jgi:hypothetical protein